MTSSTSEKVRENRLRRMAERQGFRLSKVRRRDPRAIDYGLWRLSNLSTDVVVHEGDIDAIEHFLTDDNRRYSK